MISEHIKAIADAVLYEGYLLYPYRHDALKNRLRWSIGVVYPRPYSEAQGNIEPWYMRTECLLEGSPTTRLAVVARFLHLLACTPASTPEEGSEQESWQEGMEREVTVPEMQLGDLLAQPQTVDISFEGLQQLDTFTLPRETDTTRLQQPLQGRLHISATRIEPQFFKLRVEIENTTPGTEQISNRHDAILLHAFVSTHTILQVEHGSFISLLEYPDELSQAVQSCQNVRTWPVLVGEQGKRDTMLSAPIILYDYPQIAPESPGTFFDGTEIDELLTLRILTLSDEEKEAMRHGSEQARQLLERVETLAPEQLMTLHGTIREWQTSKPQPARKTYEQTLPGEDYPSPRAIRIANREVSAGDRVRLHPKLRADAFDLLLNGKVARVERIQQDFENRLFLVVTLDDDPGREQWDERVLPGHRFFFAPEEVEPLVEGML